jgi:hypothetical protein
LSQIRCTETNFGVVSATAEQRGRKTSRAIVRMGTFMSSKAAQTLGIGRFRNPRNRVKSGWPGWRSSLSISPSRIGGLFQLIRGYIMRKRRKTQKTNMTRPRKSGAARNRRRLEQRRRLVALGMDEAEVNQLTSREVLTLLKHPKKVEAANS